MATATSLTAETIEELMGGWVQVSVVQETQAALLATFEAILASSTESLQNFEDVVLPGVQAELADSAISIANLTDNQIPALQVQLDSHDESLTNLNDVLIPDLQAGLNSNYEWIANLNDVVLPELYAQLDANNVLITEFNDVTLPALQADISANTAAIAAIDLTGLQAELDAAEADIVTLNTNLGTLNTNLGTLSTDLATIEGKFPIDAPDIAANAVIATKIAAGAVIAGKIAADAVTANEIAANAVTVNELAADAVTANKIAAGAVVAGKIAADAVTANEIAANAVTATELNAGAVIAGKIAADAVTATTIAAGAVIAGKIAADAVTATTIAANAVTAVKLNAGAVVAGKIAADAVTATTIAAGAVVAGKIAADAVTANEIAANAVTATEIAAGAVTALKIAALTITGDKIAADTIAVTKLIVSDLTNLVVDGDLLDPTSATWFEMSPTAMVRVKNVDEPAYVKNKNTYSAQYIYFRNENVFEIKVGDEFAVSLEVMTPATNTVDVSFNPYLAVFDQNGGSQLWRGVEEGATVFPTNTPWTKVEGTIKITEPGLATAQFNPIGDVGTGVAVGTQEIRLRKMVVRRKGTGKLIVDGTIQGKNLEINTITADQIDANTLTGDLFAAQVVMSGLVRAGDLDDNGLIISGYSEMGARGIYTFDDTGAPVFYAPTSSSDGAYLKAHVDLLSADVRDNFTMHGTNNSIATEAELTLSAGIEAPSVPPVLSQVWDQVQLNKTTAVPPHTPAAGYNLGTFALNPAQIVSMCWDSTWSCWVVLQQKTNGFRIWRFTSTGGIYNNFATGRPWVDDWNDRINAATCWNDDKNGLATIFLQGDQWYIWDPDYINKIPNSWVIDAASRPPTITYDTINNQYCLVQNNGGGSGTIHVRRFTVNSGANFPNASSVSTNNFEAGSGLSVRLNGAVFGAQSGLANAWTINSDSYQTVYVYSGSGVLQNTEGAYRCWAKPGASQAFCHNGASYVSADSAGLLTFYTNWTWTAVDAQVWVGASAADTDPAGNPANPHVGQAAGTHETPVGTMASIKLYRRSKLRISMPETNDPGAPDDADKWRLYFKRGTNVAPTDKTLLKLIGDIGSPTTPTSIIIGADATGGNPPGGIKGQPTAYNNFPGADPGRIESAGLMAIDSLPIFSVLGSGAGRWGDLTVDIDGKAVIGGDTGWINATLTSPWTNYGSPYSAVGYRKIGKQVFLRGLVKGTGGTTGQVFVLPVGFRPPGGNAMFATIVAENEQSFAATGDNPAAFTTGSANSHTHSANPPAMDVNTLVTITNFGTRLDINSSGVVSHSGGAVKATGSNWMSLEGITFLVD